MIFFFNKICKIQKQGRIFSWKGFHQKSCVSCVMMIYVFVIWCFYFSICFLYVNMLIVNSYATNILWVFVIIGMWFIKVNKREELVIRSNHWFTPAILNSTQRFPAIGIRAHVQQMVEITCHIYMVPLHLLEKYARQIWFDINHNNSYV